jgi:outer membrane murein-binding lipoprotein Lpp
MNEFSGQIGGDLGSSIFEFINQIGANSEGVLGYDSELQILKDQVAPIISVEYFSSSNTLVLTNTAGYDHIIELNDITMTPEEQKDLEDIKSQLQDLKDKVDSISSDVDELKSAGYQTAEQVDARIKDVIGTAPEALDTLQEIAKALGDDPNFAGTITNELSTKATKDELNSLKSKVDLKADKTEIPSLNGYATEDWVEGKNYLTEHQDISGLATKEELNAKADTSVVTKLQSDLTNVADVIIPEMNTNTAIGLNSKVSWDEEKKVISIPVDGSISALREANPEEGTQPEGGVLLAQRTYDSGVTLVTEVGTTKNKLTLNASERPQIDIAGGSSEKVAYLSEIPTALPSPAALTIKYNGVQEFTYNGSTAETGNFIVNASTIPMSDSDTTTLLAKIETLEARIAELESK